MQDSFSDRLQASLSRRRAGVKELVSALEISESTAYRWLAENTLPQRRLRKPLAEYLEVSESWLIDGEGPSEKPRNPGTDPTRSGDAPGDVPSSVELRDRSALVAIPTLTVTADAGDGAEVEFEEVEGFTYFPRWFVREHFGVPYERLRRLHVRGTSMRPTIEPGEAVYVALMEAGARPNHGAVYVIAAPHGLLVKRLFFDAEPDPDGGGVRYFVRVHSDNPEAGTDRLPLDVFNRDYHVIAELTRTEKPL